MRWIALILLLISPYAMAENAEQARAFSEGRYSDAVQLAQADHSPNALAFSARSLLAEAMSAEDYVPDQKLAERAEALARQALEQAPDHIEGRLQLAIALSLRAHPLSNREAMRARFGEEARDLVEFVLSDNSDNFYANGFMAVWHVEVRRRGGAIGASFMGASTKQGRKHYQTAISASPGDASTHWQYARALAALNSNKFRKEIEATLQAALDSPTENELERVMQNRAAILLKTLEQKGRRPAEQQAKDML